MTNNLHENTSSKGDNNMELTKEQLETLQLITLYNENMLARVDGDQGLATGLITFVDETQGIDVWNPFFDPSLRVQVIPTEEYSLEQLQTMLEQLHPKEVVNTGGHCTVDTYKLKVDSEVKCIGVTDDCFVGFGESEPFDVDIPTEIWVVHR